ncbi:uncharacterized protein ARMOST_19098 [Armillaria ostoyae]|uniref:Uncharacterized protein n=1 Tax=Armillaria ostoyae TaxID=47428 RepID=A0A284S3P3_ARMOS|nr:uncharacterized protein ARMOST_19098 [Armillaria ostoyae]
MVYTHDVLHDGWPLKKRSCDITFIGTEWSRFSMVKDVACLPFKYLLFQRMEAYPNMPSTTKREHQMFQDVAASKAYLASTTSIWAGQITSQDEAMFDFLFEILCATIPDAKKTFDTLHIFPSRPPKQHVTSLASLAFDARTLTPATSPASPVIPALGSRAVVFRAAKEVTRIFREAQYTFAILGSTACYLYGNGRLPNDVDILMSSHTCDLESMKAFLVAENPNRFYLVDAKTPGDTWKVLWYHDRGLKGKLEKTKVDILKPGVLHLPMIFSEVIVDKQGLPVVPMSILLPHKLQGWKDNMDSPIPRLRSKQDADAGDICSLLRIVIEGMSTQEKKSSMYWRRFALERFDEEFRRETDRRAVPSCNQRNAPSTALFPFACVASATKSLTVLTPARASLSDVSALEVVTTAVNNGGETVKLFDDRRTVLSLWATEHFTVVNWAEISVNFMGVAVCSIPSVTAKKGADHAFTTLALGESVSVTHMLGNFFNFTNATESTYTIIQAAEEVGTLTTIGAHIIPASVILSYQLSSLSKRSSSLNGAADGRSGARSIGKCASYTSCSAPRQSTNVKAISDSSYKYIPG